jgi:Xaa-Pro aminopeptidase
VPEPLGDLALEPGMVVILSPFLRLPKGGLRSEETVLVTATGAEPLAAPADAPPDPDAG